MPPTFEILQLVALLVGAGCVAGFLAGLFGIGGGAVLVPVFYQAFAMMGVDEAVRMQLCVGTSLAIIVPTSLRSFQAHYKCGAVDVDLLKSWVIAIPVGAMASSLVIAYAPSLVLKAVFAVLTLLFGLKALYKKASDWRLGADLPKRPELLIWGSGIGLFSGLIGIGGGTLNNTFMTLYNRSMRQAVATSSGVGVLIALPTIIGNIWGGWGRASLPLFSTGFINWVAVLLIIPITMLIAPLGAKTAHAITNRQLSILFGLFLLTVSARFFYSLI